MINPATPTAIPAFVVQEKIHARDIRNILDYYGDKIKILSLDCFDTLLWRKTAQPKDVFYDMQHRSPFRTLGVTAYQRIAAAARAYRANYLANESRQVSLADIYHYFTLLTDDQKKQLADEELQTEIETCYAFWPFVELIRQAIHRGIKIVIISDIYLHTAQLRQLLNMHLPIDVMNAIEYIFCSIDHGKSKSDGLFCTVLEKLNASAQTILHIGDHQTADYESPKKLGLHALHFLQFNPKTLDFLRLQHTTSSLAPLSNPSIQHTRKARYSPFRGIFSYYNPPTDKPETLIGYMTFGPMLYAFAQFINDELAAIKQTRKKVKTLFLLRDAFLLYRACEAFSGEPIGQLARIRKFTAVAASFRTRADVDYYISGIAPQHYNVWVICEQLLLPTNLITQINEFVSRSNQPQETFNQLIHQENILQIIFKNSAAARGRLKKYMQNVLAITEGDTIVLVDTGYIGVTQDFLTRALQDELKIEIIGRYFIASHEPDRPVSKSLLTSTWCEHGLFEQSGTFKEGTVLGYDENGNPIFDIIKLSDQQYEKVQALQNQCVRFILDAKEFFSNSTFNLSPDILQSTAEAVLHRQIFFPTREEINYFSNFQHDKDLGNNFQKTMYNTNQASALLQYHATHKPHPYENRAMHLDLSLSAIAQRAFELDFLPEEKSYYGEKLRCVVMKDTQNSTAVISATKTQEGFYSCCIHTQSSCHLGIFFGEAYQWVQIERIHLLNQPDINFVHDSNKLFLSKMQQNNTVFSCDDQEGLLMLLPFKEPNCLVTYQVIFRPLIRRS